MPFCFCRQHISKFRYAVYLAVIMNARKRQRMVAAQIHAQTSKIGRDTLLR